MMEHICDALKDKVRCADCGAVYQLIEVDDTGWYLEAAADDMIRNCHPLEIGKHDLAEMVNRDGQFIDLGLDYLPEHMEEILIRGWAAFVRTKPMTPEHKSKLLHLQDYWLAQQSLAGNEQAKEVLYLEYASWIRKKAFFLGRRINLKPNELEDLEQNVWLRAFQYLHSYNGQYRFGNWLKGILLRECYSEYGKRNNEIPSEGAVQIKLDILQVGELNDIDRFLAAQHVEGLLSVLTPRERSVVENYLFRGKTQISMAKELHLCRQRVNQIYNEALSKMRQRILEEANE